MALFKCKMCGGALEVSTETVATCEYCGTQQTLPKLEDDRRANLYDRANHFRRNNEFDKAMGIYENILNEDNTDAEAYWSLVLCRYGIEYVEDPTSHKRMPTVNRAQFTSIFDDDNYKSALQYADGYQRSIYEEEAKAINEIQKGILAISQKEEPFDVFICYKESDRNGRRTPDSVLANDLYHQLTQEGFKVFFARITLEDKLGVAYEPYIFAALNSAKVMVVLGTKPEYFNAVWVKNEWSRYLALIKNGAKKILIPAYKDMDPYDLPEEFSHLQAQDMSKLGFMQDLIRGIKKITQADAPKTSVIKETVITGGNNNTAPLLERAFMFLEDGDWNSSNEYCEKVLDIDPKNAQAYLGKLMAELHVRKQDSLQDQAAPFDGYSSYQKAIRFADDSLRTALTGYIEFINNRNEHNRLEGIYNKATSQKRAAKTEKEFKAAATTYGTIATYRDADALKQECLELAENARKDAIYDKAMSLFSRRSIPDIEQAISQFKTIPGWKDADGKVIECQQKIERIKQEDEEKRIQDEKEKKIRTKNMVVVTSIGAVFAAILMLIFGFIIPNNIYQKAIALANAGQNKEAYILFQDILTYQNSAEWSSSIEKSLLAEAEGYYLSGDAAKAAVLLEEAGIDSDAAKSYRHVANGKYKEALALGLETIVIPSNFSRIDNFAFEGCRSLTSIVIPNNITEIGPSAFKDCCFLTSVTIPNSVKSIGADAFDGCYNLKNITIPDSVISIGAGAFSGCYSLTSITIPNGIKHIAEGTFICCNNLSQVSIPNSVTYIGDAAFYSCESLTSIKIPNTVTYIGDDAFAYCESLKSINIPNGVTYLGREAFASCDSLTSITIPNSITRIEKDTFYSCDMLSRVSIPNSVTYIDDGAFYDCDNLKSITIPESVTHIGKDAFYLSGLENDVFQDPEGWKITKFSHTSSFFYMGPSSAAETLIQNYIYWDKG